MKGEKDKILNSRHWKNYFRILNFNSSWKDYFTT